MGNRLKDLRIDRGWTHEQAAEAMGVSRSQFIKLERGERKLTEQYIDLAAKAFEVPPVEVIAEYGGAGRPEVSVPDLAIHGGMGDGGLMDVSVDQNGDPKDPDQLRGYWTFPDYMVSDFGNLKTVYAWQVRGDSMEPTLPGGSVVFVDTSQRTPPPDDIYAIDYGDGLMVKRLKLVPRSKLVSVISDNERYGADDLPREHVHIYGRIVGWFQWRG